jgi:malonyl-CoA O-methyltransferase
MPANQFDRYAISYSQNRDIQKKIAQKLLRMAAVEQYKRIVDIGCGDGAVYEECGGLQEFFLGVDSSPKMCDLHRSHGGCSVLCGDFDDPKVALEIKKRFGKFDLLVSSSALQWSRNLSNTILELSGIARDFAIAIFTSGTFVSIRKCIGVNSFLPTVDDVKNSFASFCVKELLVESYKKEFDTPHDALRFIKTTGVSGGANSISYKQAKKLYTDGPSVLEFEVVYLVGSFEKSDFSIS